MPVFGWALGLLDWAIGAEGGWIYPVSIFLLGFSGGRSVLSKSVQRPHDRLEQ